MEQTYVLLLFLWANVDFTLTQEDQAVKLDTYDVQIQQLQNKSQDQANKLIQNEVKIQQLQTENQDQANKLEKHEVQIQQLQKKSQDDHTLLQELRAQLALLQTKVETLEQNQTKIAALIMCSQLPIVERAFVKDEDRKEPYEHGDVIYFSCVPGYTLESNITYVCTEDGWRATTTGHCRLPCKFLLDPNSMDRWLRLSEDLRSVTYVEEVQPYPAHRDRFTDHRQILSSSGLMGHCYWEVDWRMEQERGMVDVAVSYRTICRARKWKCGFGLNPHSWSLEISGGKFYVKHDDKATELPGRVGVSSGTVGVSLDWEGGALSFFDITNEGRFHLYTFNSSFTKELLPGLAVGFGSSASVVELNQD